MELGWELLICHSEYIYNAFDSDEILNITMKLRFPRTPYKVKESFPNIVFTNSAPLGPRRALLKAGGGGGVEKTDGRNILAVSTWP